MKFGLRIKQPGIDAADYPQVARVAEEHGFESVWIPEHVVMPLAMPNSYPYRAGGTPNITSGYPELDPIACLSSIASATTSIRLGTAVALLPLRHAIFAARQYLTLDRLSRGRAIAGIGVGWLAEEYAYLNVDFQSRGRRIDEQISVLRALWAQDVVEHHGEFYNFGPARFEPKPHGSIPIQVGGSSKAALRRAGRLCDGWIDIGSRTIEDFIKRHSVVEAERRLAGRESGPFEVTVDIGILEAHRMTDYDELGITRALAGPTPNGPLAVAELTEWIEQFASSVMV